jgi:hypothetical protein
MYCKGLLDLSLGKFQIVLHSYISCCCFLTYFIVQKHDNRIRYKFFNLEHLLLCISNIQIQLNINKSFHVAFLSADYRDCNQVTIGLWLTWCELVNVAIHTCKHFMLKFLLNTKYFFVHQTIKNV